MSVTFVITQVVQEIKSKLLLTNYEQLWEAWYGEIGSWFLIGIRVAYTLNSSYTILISSKNRLGEIMHQSFDPPPPPPPPPPPLPPTHTHNHNLSHDPLPHPHTENSLSVTSPSESFKCVFRSLERWKHPITDLMLEKHVHTKGLLTELSLKYTWTDACTVHVRIHTIIVGTQLFITELQVKYKFYDGWRVYLPFFSSVYCVRLAQLSSAPHFSTNCSWN